METTHCTIDGWVDAIPAPGPHGTAMFDLAVRPVDAGTLPEDAPTPSSPAPPRTPESSTSC